MSEANPKGKEKPPPNGQNEHVTVASLAETKGLPVAFLEALGVHDLRRGGIGIPYFDASGSDLFIRKRDVPGRPRFEQPTGVKLQPYGLWRLDEARKVGRLFLVEGESDCWVLWHHDEPALGVPGSTSPKILLAEHVEQIDEVYVVKENDDGGKTFLKLVPPRLEEIGYRGGVYELDLPADVKDVNDLHILDPDQFRGRWDEAVRWARCLTKGDDWEGDKDPLATPAKTDEAKQPRRFTFMSSREFATSRFSLEWDIEDILVKGQPGVVGGPKKSLKTSLIVELALSAGSGRAFLNHFVVPRPLRVGIISGESGPAVLHETAHRIAAAKEIDFAGANVFWGFELPQLADVGDLAALQEAIEEQRLEVLFLDPLYLAMLAGAGPGGPQASNMYQMGPLLLNVAKTCLEVGCTPHLAHHFKLNRSNPYDEPQLEDLAFSGIQEFVRQWVLVARRERYEPGSGHHELWLSVGGSAGHSGSWALTVDEGTVDQHFRGRFWSVSLAKAGDAREAAKDGKQAAKREEKLREEQGDEAKVMQALDQLDPKGEGTSSNRVRIEAQLSDERMKRTVARLVKQKLVEETSLLADIGNGAQRKASGLRRLPEDI